MIFIIKMVESFWQSVLLDSISILVSEINDIVQCSEKNLRISRKLLMPNKNFENKRAFDILFEAVKSHSGSL